jgi:hypothetical protein
MPLPGTFKFSSALFLTIFFGLAVSSHAVVPPLYGPFSPVFIGAETNQFGFYANIIPTGQFQANFEGTDAVQWNGTTQHSPNPNGAVGPKQYVQWTQGGFQAYDKQTGAAMLCPVNNPGNLCPNNQAKPVSWGNFWDGSVGSKVYECGHGSPTAGVLIYDQLDEVATSVGATRTGHWIMATHVNHGVHIYYCVAVSSGSDILHASWNEYEFQLDGNGSGGQGGVLPYSTCSAGCITGLYTPDYLKLGTSVEVKKAATFLGGLYATWDLYAPGSADSFVAGFEACTLNRNDLVNGRATTSMSCYYDLPANNFPWVSTTSTQSVIHSLLPADFEGTVTPPLATVTEYFLAAVNPYTGALSKDSPCVSSPTCASTQLALYTMGVDSGHPLKGPKMLTVKSFTPGCYNNVNTRNTFCVAQPTSGRVIDSIGDRLMHRLAYRVVKSTSTEQLVAAQTISNGAVLCTGNDLGPCTAIEWYKLVNPGASVPSVLQGAVLDPGHSTNFLFMPSVATNSAGNLQFTFEESGDTFYPSLYTVPVTFAGLGGTGAATEGTVKLIVGGGGDQEDSEIFGEYYSTTIDPCDDATFWGTGEYFRNAETSKTGLNWQTRIYTTATSTPTECTF